MNAPTKPLNVESLVIKGFKTYGWGSTAETPPNVNLVPIRRDENNEVKFKLEIRIGDVYTYAEISETDLSQMSEYAKTHNTGVKK